MFDRKKFFALVKPLFGSYDAHEIEGIDAILDEAEKRGTPRNWLAYIFATAYHETNRTMQPVREAYWVKNAEAWRKRHLRYYPYYGRGLVQLTWEYNYKKAKEKLGVDFVMYPDKVMEMDYAIQILFVGMDESWFTGKRLADAIDLKNDPDGKERAEYIAARKIINGTDEAAKIAGYALSFEHALESSEWENDPEPHVLLPPVKSVPLPGVEEKPSLGKPGNVPMNIGGS